VVFFLAGRQQFVSQLVLRSGFFNESDTPLPSPLIMPPPTPTGPSVIPLSASTTVRCCGISPAGCKSSGGTPPILLGGGLVGTTAGAAVRRRRWSAMSDTAVDDGAADGAAEPNVEAWVEVNSPVYSPSHIFFIPLPSSPPIPSTNQHTTPRHNLISLSLSLSLSLSPWRAALCAVLAGAEGRCTPPARHRTERVGERPRSAAGAAGVGGR
jgi:hypothetical protein